MLQVMSSVQSRELNLISRFNSRRSNFGVFSELSFSWYTILLPRRCNKQNLLPGIVHLSRDSASPSLSSRRRSSTSQQAGHLLC